MGTHRVSARDLIASIADPDSVESWDSPIDVSGYSEHYQRDIERAKERSGCDESILTGSATVNGRRVAFIVNEFGFLAGSIGQAAADRIVAAVHRATAERLPLLASSASGGTRMQEGTPAFVKMIDISRAVTEHKAAGLPYMAYLRHPTTGGVFASWGSLAHVTVAEPGALVGFLGPKVYELLNGRTFPTGVQQSENLAEHGIIDAVATAEELPMLIERALAVLCDDPSTPRLVRRDRREPSSVDHTWESILRTRSTGRAGVRDVLRTACDSFLPMHGTDEGERESAIIVALARLDGVGCVIIGQDREAQSPEAPMGPGALREARRGMKIAQELNLPLVSFIDTPGAELSAEAEEGAIAGEIARCIAAMSSLTVPTVSVLLGQGTGGGALALLPAKVTIAAEHSWLSPLPPEGASAIVHGHIDAANEMAVQQRVSAVEMWRAGIVRALVPEFDDDSPSELARAVAGEVSFWLRELVAGRA